MDYYVAMQKRTTYRGTRSARYPELVYIVITRTPDGKYNPMSASWAMFTSIEPPMLAVSVGFTRYTYELIKSAGEFVLAIPSEKMAREVGYFGTESGRDVDKLNALKTLTQPAAMIDSRLLSQASANYECKVNDSLVTGDHVIFSADILASHIHDELLPRILVLDRRIYGGVQAKPATN